MTAQGMTGASVDLVELLTRQHREVEQLWSQLQMSHRNASGDEDRLARDIVKLLSQHDAIEAQLLYPELRDVAGDEGGRWADHSLEEHHRVRDLLTKVDEKPISDETVFSTMSQCISAVTEHVGEEEQRVFPLLREHCGPQRLTELGTKAEQMLPMLPTHPHPHTPDSKIGATVAGAVAGAVDRARDALRNAGRG